MEVILDSTHEYALRQVLYDVKKDIVNWEHKYLKNNDPETFEERIKEVYLESNIGAIKIVLEKVNGTLYSKLFRKRADLEEASKSWFRSVTWDSYSNPFLYFKVNVKQKLENLQKIERTIEDLLKGICISNQVILESTDCGFKRILNNLRRYCIPIYNK